MHRRRPFSYVRHQAQCPNRNQQVVRAAIAAKRQTAPHKCLPNSRPHRVAEAKRRAPCSVATRGGKALQSPCSPKVHRGRCRGAPKHIGRAPPYCPTDRAPWRVRNLRVFPSAGVAHDANVLQFLPSARKPRTTTGSTQPPIRHTTTSSLRSERYFAGQ